MKLTNGSSLFFIVIFTILRCTTGDIKINSPQKIHENDRVELTCTVDYPKASTLLEKMGHCSLWWSKPGDNESNHQKKILKDDEDVTIIIMHGRNQRPESSTLTIPRMTNMWEGRYSCHVWCATLMETGTITLTITPENKIGNILNDKASVIGAIVTIFAILIICIASCCCIAVETCKRQNRPRRGSHGNHASDHEDAHLYDSSSTLSSLAPSLNDAPPRYSLVVVSSAGQNGSVNILPSNASQECRNSHLLNAIVEQDNISGLFVIPSPPPNYRQALMDLAEKGIIFNPENLRPPPPAYDELEDIDLNSSTGSHAPDHLA